MPAYTLCGDDTLVLNGRNITNFIDGGVLQLAYPNEIMNLATGKDGSTVFAKSEQGVNATLELRILRGTDDDIWLNGRLIAQNNDPINFILLNGSYVKRLGAGVEGGRIRRDVYTLAGGMFNKIPDTMFDTAGDTDQGVTVYNLTFASAIRAEG